MATQSARKKSNGRQASTAGRSTKSPARRGTRKSKVLAFTTPEERRRLIEKAAYLKAEQRGFQGGNAEQDWLEAEAEIDADLAGRK